LYYNEKHKDITTHNINGFVAAYNCGVCQRIIGKYEESIRSFNIALKMSKEENVFKFVLKLYLTFLGFRIVYCMLVSDFNF